MPKDTSKFGKVIVKDQIVTFTDSTISGSNILYRCYKNFTATQSVRDVINSGVYKIVGGNPIDSNTYSTVYKTKKLITDSLGRFWDSTRTKVYVASQGVVTDSAYIKKQISDSLNLSFKAADSNTLRNPITLSYFNANNGGSVDSSVYSTVFNTNRLISDSIKNNKQGLDEVLSVCDSTERNIKVNSLSLGNYTYGDGIKYSTVICDPELGFGAIDEFNNTMFSIGFFNNLLLGNRIASTSSRIDSLKGTLNLSYLNITEDKTQYFQDKNGTIALLSDIPDTTFLSQTYRKLDNHDSLKNLAERSYNSLTDKPTSTTILNNFQEAIDSTKINTSRTQSIFSPKGNATNIDFILSPKGNGCISANKADSTWTGGYKRGVNAVDWQTNRSNASYVASGGSSVISGGVDNTASGVQCVVSGGYNNTASISADVVSGGRYNVASGGNSTVSGGQENNATGSWSTVAGGYRSTASNDYTFAVGSNAQATNLHSVAIGGYSAYSHGVFSTVIGGYGSEAYGFHSGSYNSTGAISRGAFSIALGGIGIVANDRAEVVTGLFPTIKTSNVPLDSICPDTSRLYCIGNGNSTSTRSNAFEVYKGGTVLAPSATIAKINSAPTYALITKEYAATRDTVGHGVINYNVGSKMDTASPHIWAKIQGTPTRATSTTFTITGDYSSYIAKGLVIKWTETNTIRCAMVSIPSTFSSPNTTITIIGDTIVSGGFDASSVKYYLGEVTEIKFAYAGVVGAVDTNIMNSYYAKQPMRIFGADLQTGVAGVTNSTTFDINKNWVSMFSVKPTLATTVRSSPTPFKAITYTSLALGDKITIDCDAIQSTQSQDAYIQLYSIPTRILNLP